MKTTVVQTIRKRPWVMAFALLLAALLTTAIALPVYASRQLTSARAAIAEGRAAEGRDRLRVCLLVWPRSVSVNLLAARAARLSADYEATESILQRCIKFQGGASEAIQLEFLLLRVQTGEVDEVLPALSRLVEESHPESANILETVSRAFMHNLRFGLAYSTLTRWVELDPKNPKPLHWRGWTLERLNNHKLALVDYQKALELDPNSFAIRLRVAELYLDDENPPLAKPHLEKLMEEYPNRVEVKARLGQYRFLQGKLEESRKLLEAALAEQPEDTMVLLYLGKLDLLGNRPKEAEEKLRRLLQIDPSDMQAGFSLVASLNQQGRSDEAEAALARHVKLKGIQGRVNKLLRDEAEHPTNDPSVACDIGKTLLELKQYRLGLHWLNEALKRDPKYSDAHKALADHYERQGDTEIAASHRRQVTRSGSR